MKSRIETLLSSTQMAPSGQLTAKDLVHTLFRHGISTFFCGGTARDLVENRVPKDIDITCMAEFTVLHEILLPLEAAGKIRLAHVDAAFGHLTIEGSVAVDINMVRDIREVDFESGPYPECRLGRSLEDDLPFRDFSFNALYIDASSGELYDFCNGLCDLRERRISLVRDPRIAKLTPTTGLRMIKFMMQGFEPTGTSLLWLGENLRLEVETRGPAGLKKWVERNIGARGESEKEFFKLLERTLQRLDAMNRESIGDGSL